MKLVNVLPLFVLVLFGVLNVTARIQFRHGGEPMDMTVLQGESAYFRCYIDGIDDNTRYRIDWNIKGRWFTSHDLDSVHKYYVSTGSIPGAMLIVKTSDSSDRGSYYCAVYVDGRVQMYSKAGYLNVIQKPSFQHPFASSVTVVEGQSVVLHCRIQNFEVRRFNVSWFRNYAQLSQNNRISDPNVSQSYGIIQTIGRYRPTRAYDLKITDVSRANQGYFHCGVFMGSRQVLKSNFVWLNVLYPPDKQYPLCSPKTPSLYSLGDTLRTTCHSQGGNSQIGFYWIKDRKIQPATHSGDYLVENEWNLTESDNGTYIRCSMRGPAILDERQCTIGPIRIHNDSGSSDIATKAMHDTDKILSNSPKISSELTLSITTTLSKVTTSPVQTRSLHFEVKPNKIMRNHLTYILTVLISFLIVVVITITAVCVRSKKTSVKDNAIEAINKNDSDSCKVTNAGVEDNMHYEALRINVNSDTAHYEKLSFPAVATDPATRKAKATQEI
ncbi:cell adhesion molecule 2-like [Ptychodera flava]|uniref:cell adhesion molecule 2-like n=1 Tax=Ptychodera flava TaxID=63121 RepID=UPI00396A3A57